ARAMRFVVNSRAVEFNVRHNSLHSYRFFSSNRLGLLVCLAQNPTPLISFLQLEPAPRFCIQARGPLGFACHFRPSEVKLQSELDDARAAARRRDPPESLRYGDVAVRISEIGPVEEIEELGAKL